MLRLENLHARLHIPTPIEKINWPELEDYKVAIHIKRDDLIHSLISGNKWRKLKYNIEAVIQNDYKYIVTFGGVFSNHLVAVAVAGHYLKIPTVGILRAYIIDEANPTIRILRNYGMTLHTVNPSEYKLKESSIVIQNILDKYINHFLIPEGGTNKCAIRGVQELWNEVNDEYSHVVVGLGTAGTLAGLVNSAPKKTEIIAISSFKGSVDELEGLNQVQCNRNYKIVPSQIKGGFGSYNKEIEEFGSVFYNRTGIHLDPIYTIKVMSTLLSLIKGAYFPKGANILFVHTGGLQGILGYNYLHGSKMKELLPLPLDLKIFVNNEC